MSVKKQRAVYWVAVCLATFVVPVALVIKAPGILPWGKMVAPPASLDGVVTISTSPDTTLIFITCSPDHSTFWQRISHSTLSGAFVVQHGGPTHKVVTRTGSAHIEFQGDLLSIVFTDSSRFVFTTARKGSISLKEDDFVDYAVGLATHSVIGLSTHSDFVGSRDWTMPGSCNL
jgi:hypothetical protein